MNQDFRDDSLQPVPMLDFSREFATVRTEVLSAIERVCESQRFILGPEVERFESAAAKACQVPYAVGCASGTDALWLALASARIGEGHVVITTPFTFFATVSSILRVGAKPVLADIDEHTFNLSPEAVRQVLMLPECITSSGSVAVMPVHLYGQCADIDGLKAASKDTELLLVEDAAQAWGATWNDIPAGALGNAAAFSFYPTKNLSAFGDAGLMTTKDATQEEHARMLRAHGMRQRYFHDEVGWNSRLDSIQAAVLSVKLGRVSAGNRRRRELAALYSQRFQKTGLVGTSTEGGIVLPFTDPRAEHVFHQYVIRVPRRNELRTYLSERRIGSEIYYPLPLHLQQSLKSLGYKRGDFPVSEKAAEEVLALPIYPELREDEVETVVEAIRRFYA